MNILAHGANIAFSNVALVAGVTITYARGTTTKQVQAIAGTQTLLQETDYDNLVTRRHRESFLVTPSDLLDTFGEPQAGDTIQYTPEHRSDIVLTFTLRPDNQGDPVFRPTDRYHTRWRVNAILTLKEDA